MKEEDQRIAIAKATGITVRADGSWYRNDTNGCEDGNTLPNYTSDLNAMHEAEKVVEEIMHKRGDDYAYGDKLVEVTQNPRPISATAPQRAEAFLRTLNLWKD